MENKTKNACSPFLEWTFSSDIEMHVYMLYIDADAGTCPNSLCQTTINE